MTNLQHIRWVSSEASASSVYEVIIPLYPTGKKIKIHLCVRVNYKNR